MSGFDVGMVYLLLMFLLGGVNGCSKNEPLGKNILYHICMQKFGTLYISPIILVHYCFHINYQSFVGIQEETTSKITTNVASSSTTSKLITNSTANDNTTPRSSIGNLQALM